MIDLFRHLAGYNAWANARLYEAVLALEEERQWRPIGLFFGSLGGTLNHLLVTDRVWMKRFTGTGDHPDKLSAILHHDVQELWAERQAEDQRISSYVDQLDEAKLETRFTYRMMTRPDMVTSTLWPDLLHFFNHQTHHRGQAHTGLSIVTGNEPPPLDMIYYARAKV